MTIRSAQTVGDNGPFRRSADRLLAAFGNRRPLRAGSLIVTVFGDAIAPRGAPVAMQSLVQLMALFGANERLVRTSMGRLAAEGWFRSERRGRRAFYRLTASGARRFAEATERIYSPPPERWDGSWTLAVFPRPTAASLRRQLALLGFGQLGGETFAHPTLDPARAAAQLDGADPAPLVFRASPLGADENRAIAASGWDLDAMARRYRTFTDRFEPAARAVAATPPDGADPAAFCVRTLLIHEYRRIHLRDPLLPASLLPPGWVGSTAYALCRQLYGALLPPSEAFLDATLEPLDGVTATSTSAVHRRFDAAGPEPGAPR